MIRIDMETKISFYQQLSKLSSNEMIAYFMPTNYTEETALYAQNTKDNGNTRTIKRKIR